MKYLIPTLSLLICSSFASAQQEGDVLQGDKKTACEVTMCLMAGERPDECTDPLKEYFSIKNRDKSKQLSERKDFLELCPSGESDERLQALVVANEEESTDSTSTIPCEGLTGTAQTNCLASMNADHLKE